MKKITKKLKIGFFTDTYLPQINGVVTAIQNLKKALENLGHEVYILTAHVPGYKDNEKNVIRFKSTQAFFHPELRFPTFFGPTGLKKIINLKLDIVHSHTPLSLGLMAEFISSLQRVPHIHSYHTVYPEVILYLSNNKYLNKIVQKYLAEKAVFIYLNRCEKVLTHSQKTCQYLKARIKTPITTFPLGVNIPKKPTTKTISDLRKKYKIKKNESVIVWAGRVGKEKNLPLLFKIFKSVTHKNPDIKLLIIGDGPSLNEYKEQVKKDKIDDKIIFTGYVKHNEIKKYYYLGDLFLFTSLVETFGLVILEAMSCELPIITVKDKAYQLTVLDNINGYQISKTKINHFTKKIIDVLKDKDLKKRLSISSLTLAKKFTIKSTAKNIEKIYYENLK